jgi:glycosyltransferase involved in cell wall biosynthesis
MPSRYAMWGKLQTELRRQALSYPGQIEFMWDSDPNATIGAKRNKLLNQSHFKYIVFIDDDDAISENYIELLMQAAATDCDCASLKGVYSVDGKEDGVFEHSIKYNEWKTNPLGSEVKYIRTPNHLSMLRASIAKQFKFPDTSWGEDHDWSKQIHESGLLKTEYYINDIIYYYNKLTK